MSADPIDRLDYRILTHLQRDGRCSNVDLADAVGLSPSPCLLRTKKLQEGGFIRGFTADIALEKLGDYVIVFSEVTLGSHSRQDFQHFEKRIVTYPEVLECYNVSGGYDYLLKIIAPGVSHFQRLMDRMLEDGIGIEKFSSRIVLRQPFQPRPCPLDVVWKPDWLE
jgi:DNA-binding Lrp family transcriptional regulator